MSPTATTALNHSIEKRTPAPQKALLNHTNITMMLSIIIPLLCVVIMSVAPIDGASWGSWEHECQLLGTIKSIDTKIGGLEKGVGELNKTLERYQESSENSFKGGAIKQPDLVQQPNQVPPQHDLAANRVRKQLSFSDRYTRALALWFVVHILVGIIGGTAGVLLGPAVVAWLLS